MKIKYARYNKQFYINLLMKGKRFCSCCNNIKVLDSFGLDKQTPDGYSRYCKVCKRRKVREAPSATRGTIEAFKLKTWSSLNSRTINGSHPDYKDKNKKYYLNKNIRLQLSKEEFYNWCEQNKDLILSFYKKGITPSIDRKDSKKNYSLTNIRILSLNMNSKNGALKSSLITRKKAIGIHTITGKVISFSPIRRADLHGFQSSNIYLCIRGKRLTHKGYKWFYA